MYSKSLAFLVLLGLSFAQASYFDGGDDEFDQPAPRSLYTRAVKSPPPVARVKSYAPPPPSRARYVSPPAVKTYQAPATKSYQAPARIEQQTYEQQSYAPQIDHSVVSIAYLFCLLILTSQLGI